MRHTKIQTLLYEYLNNSLSKKERMRVEEHLAGCQRCDRELNELKTTIERVKAISESPSDARPQEYWNNFATVIDNRITQEQQRPVHSTPSLVEWLKIQWVFRPKFATVLGSGLAIAIIAIILWKRDVTPPSHATSERINPHESVTNSQPLPVQLANERLRDYFRKSRTLLVGIANMKLDEHASADFSLERGRSRELINEARFLKSQPIDSRSEELIRDLEKILIELSSIEETKDLPNIEIVRGGIHQENLLFKIRMAEAMYNQPMLQNAKYSVEGQQQ